jgi:ABC-type nickel/cobalt efflux system permease component RcnA
MDRIQFIRACIALAIVLFVANIFLSHNFILAGAMAIGLAPVIVFLAMMVWEFRPRKS